MNIEEYIAKMRNIQETLLRFLEKDDDYEKSLSKFTDFIQNQNIQDQCFTEFINIIFSISQNHHREHNLIRKIENILTFLKDDLMKHFSNERLFDKFQNNKRILLFLIEEQFITLDKYVQSQLSNNKFFEPELKSKEVSPEFEEKRKKGENDEYICQLIQKDSIEEFITYINETSFPLSGKIEANSIFETNSFLLEKKNSSLIEYAAFYGSIQIFQYLLRKNVQLTPSLWLYTIHSNNAELINLLEENEVQPEDKTFKECFEESIKCYHNEIADYIANNLLKDKHDDKSKLIGYFNFDYFPEDIKDDSVFASFCEFEYLYPVSILINSSNVNYQGDNVLK